MSVASAESRDAGGGHDSISILDSATIPDNISIDDPKYAFLNELLQQREQDLLAAADIGEMLLEKNRVLNQKVADMQALLDEQRRRSTRSDGLALSSDGGEDDDDDDDDSSEDEKLNADGSVILTGRRGRVSLLHETQMTQRRTSGRGQAMREAAERQEMLERATKEAEHADETIAALLADGLMLSSLLHWRRLADKRQSAELRSKAKELDRRVEAADATATSAAETAAAMAAEQRLAQDQAAAAAHTAKETITALHQDLHRTQTVKMQEKKDFETQIAALQELLFNQKEEAGKIKLSQEQVQADKMNLQTELDKAHSELVRASGEQAILQALVSTQREELETSKSLSSHLEADTKSLQDELEKLQRELGTFSAKMEVENSEKRVLQGMMEDVKLDAETRVAHLAAAKNKELTELKAKLQDTQDERQQLKIALKEAREMLEDMESQHQVKLQNLQGELEEVEKNLANTKDTAIKCQRDLEDLAVDAQEKLEVVQAEMETIRETREAQLRDLQKQMSDADASAAASAESAQEQQRNLQDKTKELEMKVKQAEMAREIAAAEANEREMQMRRRTEENIRALKQEIRKGLLALSERSYKTESCMADVEVEVAKYSTHLTNWHYLEVSALEREMLATSSQAKLEEQKKMMQAFKKEEDLKVQLQLLSASLAQKDENIDTLSRERSQKEAQTAETIKVMQQENASALLQAEAKLLESQKSSASLQKGLNESVRSASAKYEQAAGEVAELKLMVRELKQAVKGRDEQSQILTDGNTQLQMQLSRGMDELSSVQKALMGCKEQLADKERELEAQQSRAKDEQASAQKALMECKKQLVESQTELEAAQDSMKERDLLAGEAAVKMLQLESKVESDEAEIKKLKALVLEAKNNFQALEQSKSSAIAQLEARCDGLERGLDLMTTESSTASQELSQLRKKMHESYVQAQREKNELTDQLKLMEDRLKRLRLEAEDNEKHLKEELREREADNKTLTASLHEQTGMNKTMEEGNRRLHDTMRSQLTRLRDDLDSSRLLDASLLDESAQAPTPEKSSGVSSSAYNRSMLSRSVKEGAKQDDDATLLGDLSTEMERIKAAIHYAEAQNEQLMAKVSTLDSTLQGQKTLNETLQVEAAQAHELAARAEDADRRTKKLEGEKVKYQEKIVKLEEKIQKVKKIAHEEAEKERIAREKEMSVLEEEVSRLIRDENQRENELAAAREAIGNAAKEAAFKVEEAQKAAQGEVQDLRKEVDALKAQVAAAKDELAAAHEAISSAGKEAVIREEQAQKTVQGEMQSLRNEVEVLKKEAAAAAEEGERLKGQVDTAQVLEEKLRKDLAETTRVGEATGLKAKEGELELATARSEILQLRSDIQHLQLFQATAATAASAAELTHAQQVEELDRQVLALQSEIREANQHLVVSDTAAQELEAKLAWTEQDKNLAEQMLSKASENRHGEGAHVNLPELQELQARFDEYRLLAAAQADEANLKIKGLERQLDDRISEATIANSKAVEEMRERERERQDRARCESEAAAAAADLQHQRLRQMSSTAALKKQADLHKIETDELYCQMIVLRNNQAQLLDELVALEMQRQTEEGQVSAPKIRRKMQEKLGKARENEQNVIKEELQRVTGLASTKRTQLMMKEGCSYAA